MGVVFSTLMATLFGSKKFKFVILGLDNSGKTTILFRLSLNETVSTQPTIGCNLDTIKIYTSTSSPITATCWDLGGQESMRSIWNSYYANDTDAVILVIDSTDRDRLPIVRYELDKILGLESLTNAHLLLLANKQDIEGCLTPVEIVEALNLTELKRPYHLQGTCAITGDGLQPGLQWLADQLK